MAVLHKNDLEVWERLKLEYTDGTISYTTPVLVDINKSELSLYTDYTKTGNIATFTARVMYGDEDVTNQYDDRLFKWYKKTESGEIFIGTGKLITLNASEMGYGGTVVCDFAEIRECRLLDKDLNPLVDKDGNNYIVRS